ncbi:protein D1 isoform X3 [Bemisia tabaci]|uniref:protein D1 isoform X3 n=1 Tax=Bemisia tabaci TaxID=7038 RepID=UPI003B28BA5D
MKTLWCVKNYNARPQYLLLFTQVWLPRILAKVSPFVVREMDYFKIMPDLVTEVPPFICQVNWAKADADFGNRLEPHEVPVQPIETIWPTDEGKLYTLMLLAHRLVFLVFEQPTPTHINFEVVTKKAQLEHDVRGKFSWREFAKRWELGAPLAINFFQIERPDPSDRRAQINPTDSENEGGWFNF